MRCYNWFSWGLVLVFYGFEFKNVCILWGCMRHPGESTGCAFNGVPRLYNETECVVEGGMGGFRTK